MARTQSRYPVLIPALLTIILIVPWLGEMFFYSKGEPREAIVAVSMLDSGDWILPVSYGGDIPYKPPFFAWLIALASLLFNGGGVSEFTSRLPSALAAVAILVATWRLIVSRTGRDRAWITIIVLATSFEFYRAAVACRVDMVLTACMIGAIYGMYTMRGRPWRVLCVILLLSGATLTKGPVGTLLPCLSMGIYFVITGSNFFRTFVRLTLIALASFVIPALWYWLAYRHGGDSFASLAWEENIGRLTGSMGYESHVNPWYYNIVTIISGMLPWTLPVAVALLFRRVRRAIADAWRSRSLRPGLSTLAWTVGLTVFIFYCIPSSKRSVYLLPCYPFLAYGVAWLLNVVRIPRIMSVWANILAALGVLLSITAIVGQFVSFGKITFESLTWNEWIIAVLPSLAGGWWLATRSRHANGLAGVCGFTLLLFMCYGGAYAPMVMNPRSDIHAARIVAERVPEGAPLLSDIPQDSLLRYYSMNFYLDDRIRRIEVLDSVPADAWILSGESVDPVRSEIITHRSCDTRRPVFLTAPRQK